MKKFYLLITLILLPFLSAEASGPERNRSYGEAVIFYEDGVEFAIFPDGQFDFFFDPRYTNVRSIRINPRSDFSFNRGYNYDPYVQYDDFGAVVQIAHVPVYYDHYGRIIQAGSVPIYYNFFGQVERIGNLFLQYDHFQRLTGYSGFINVHNTRYTPRPWHRYYIRPHAHSAIVYHRPYREYYYVNRLDYDRYRQYYNNYDHDNFRRSYYRPGQEVTSYHRGRRTESSRSVRSARTEARDTDYSNLRNNKDTWRYTTPSQNSRPDDSQRVRRNSDAYGQQDRGTRTQDSRSRDTRRSRSTERSEVNIPSRTTPDVRGRGNDRRTERASQDISVRQPREVSSRSRNSRGRE